MIPNANVATSSFDRISGSFAVPKSQPYNRFRIQTTGANIVQGQVNKLSLTELMMPYDIPTIVKDVNDKFFIYDYLYTVNQPTPLDQPIPYTVTLPQGYYTSAEMVAALNTIFPGLGLGLQLSASADTITGGIRITNTTAWNNANLATNHIYTLIPYDTVGNTEYDARPLFNQPQLLWTIGFRSLYAEYPWKTPLPLGPGPMPLPLYFTTPIALVPTSTPASIGTIYFPTGIATTLQGSPYSGAFTQHIDIVSPSLTQAQYVRDSTTSQNTARKDVIARVFVCDNVSLATSNQIGSRPFVIYRIFPCPKVMKWTVDRSLDAIQLELYDQFGLPLPNVGPLVITDPGAGTTQILAGPRDYSLVLHVHEHDETMEPNVGYRM